VLAPLGLRLSESKTRVCHIDEGFDFLGFRIQRHLKKGTSRKHLYTYPSKKAKSRQIRAWHLNLRSSADLPSLADAINPQVRGSPWAASPLRDVA
jgi:RNA-directed DNA polymerase